MRRGRGPTGPWTQRRASPGCGKQPPPGSPPGALPLEEAEPRTVRGCREAGAHGTGPARAPRKPPGRRRGPDPLTPLNQVRPLRRGRRATGWAKAGGGRGGTGPAGRRQRRERCGAHPEMGTSEQGAAERGASPDTRLRPHTRPHGLRSQTRLARLLASHWLPLGHVLIPQPIPADVGMCCRHWLRPGSRVPGGADNFPPNHHVG